MTSKPGNQPGGKGRAGLVAMIGAAAAALLVPHVAGWEGKRNDPYRDLVGIPTVCYGETRVEMRRYSDSECEEMLAEGLADFAGPVLDRNPELAGHPAQLAAAVSLSYNIGLGPADLRKCGKPGVRGGYRCSSIARRFSARDWRGACDAFLKYNRAGGQVVRGLDRRRRAERELCLKGLPA